MLENGLETRNLVAMSVIDSGIRNNYQLIKGCDKYQ